MILPLRLDNPLNGSVGHWSTWHHKRKVTRKAVHFGWLEAKLPRKLEPGQRVEITRIGRRMLDGDGLQAACKSVRDGAADMLGINDKMDVWEYRQAIGVTYAVEIKIV
jgi:hypothetical protein